MVVVPPEKDEMEEETCEKCINNSDDAVSPIIMVV